MISLEERVKDEAKSYLEELLSEGAKKLLQAAIERSEMVRQVFGGDFIHNF